MDKHIAEIKNPFYPTELSNGTTIFNLFTLKSNFIYTIQLIRFFHSWFPFSSKNFFVCKTVFDFPKDLFLMDWSQNHISMFISWNFRNIDQLITELSTTIRDIRSCFYWSSKHMNMGMHFVIKAWKHFVLNERRKEALDELGWYAFLHVAHLINQLLSSCEYVYFLRNSCRYFL